MNEQKDDRRTSRSHYDYTTTIALKAWELETVYVGTLAGVWDEPSVGSS